MGEIRIEWSRAELTAAREAVELTPRFDGRMEVRDALRGAMRSRKTVVVMDLAAARRFAGRLVATDLATALAKFKLLRAIQNAVEADGAVERTAEAA